MKLRALSIIALIAASCTHNALQEDMSTFVTIDVSSTETRTTSTTAENESNIHSLQVFVFDADGTIDTIGSAEGSSLKMKVTCGKGKIIWAIANYTKSLNIKNAQELQEQVLPLSASRPDGLIMCGNTLLDIRENAKINLTLTRMVSKISLSRISRQFSSPSLAARKLQIKSIYMINVPGEISIAGKCQQNGWKNRRMYEMGDSDRLLCDNNLNITLDNLSEYSTAHHFYCYPNECTEDNSDDAWSPRKTRLVIEAELGGKTRFYSLTLPEVGRNRSYVIEKIILRGKGTLTPDNPYGTMECSAQIRITDWTSGATYTEEL